MTIINLLSKLVPFPNYYCYLYLIDYVQLYFCTILFSYHLNKRKLTWLYYVIGAIVFIPFSLLLAYIQNEMQNADYIRLVNTLSMYLLALGMEFVFYKEKPRNILLSWVTALAFREIVDGDYALLACFMGNNPRASLIIISENDYVNMLFWDAIHLALIMLGFFIIKNRLSIEISKKSLYKIISVSIFLLFSVVVIKTVISAYTDNMELNTPLAYLYMASIALEIVISMVVISFRTYFWEENRYEQELDIMSKVLYTNQKQYESLKTNIDVINMKAHDIKHQLEKYQDKLTESEIDNLRQAVRVYDKRIQTGNDVLDTVLYSFSLRCDQNNIVFSYLIDGKLLNSYPTNQLYYLFSNILDNAFEASMGVEKESRVISMNIKEKNGDIFIEECNYFTGEIKISNGNIVTKKEDKSEHGFGVKSIRMIVNQNQGKMYINTTDDNMFFLTIHLPLTPKKDALA